MPAVFGLSSYGRVILIDENEDYPQTTPLRATYLLANFLMYVIPVAVLVRQYFRLRAAIVKPGRRSNAAAAAPLWLLTTLLVLFVVNNGIRSCHMVDHHYRPVYYHEPQWAYQKYLVTEMELATYANILITLNGCIAFSALLQAIYDNKITVSRPKILVTGSLYIFGAFFNLVHYTLEPPSNYGPFPNFTIAGSFLSGLPLLAMLLYTVFGWKGSSGKKTGKESKQLLVEDEDSGVGANTRASRGRRRSRTPVKGTK